MKQFEQILRDTIGLDAASIGSSMIERAVRLRRKIGNVRKRGEYQQLLRTANQSGASLSSSGGPTETWFFRDIQPFTALAQLVSRNGCQITPSKGKNPEPPLPLPARNLIQSQWRCWTPQFLQRDSKSTEWISATERWRGPSAAFLEGTLFAANN